ncbi:hypothetical protein VOLCADRAFT_90590 [Volvox carteri f. nagariensis]|uniref:Cyclic nucleotide-binding domain-containing protein n=1 Tax=Volvox carteri f. nagariensis TaxID=3068 RepID=D8TUT7_VOLCA|nr:uncharacterized protein VOLCADRAFT_90590 [Volvox carteri f. nagariensis]EFJ48767.1 hypothetical protein VOLCADRAFT_90590 [Volvox carteri f. nagariensis]|eukprot:XP_002950099.1 hypothetical protein VOLCADRAFT_90590 [Volvox carteri f. nagariensis]
MSLQLARTAHGRSQIQIDEQIDAYLRLRNDEDSAVEAVPVGGEERSLQKYSIKLEDMVPMTSIRPPDGLRGLLRPSRTASQLARPASQSQLSLTQQSNNFSGSSDQKTMHGIYGLLARHIEVPPKVWAELPYKDLISCFIKEQEEATLELSPTTTGGDSNAGAALDGAASEPGPRCSIFGLPMLHPYSRLAVAWRCAMLLFDLSFTAFWVPLNVGFCFEAYGDLNRPCTRSDFAGGIIYVINWFVGFHMGVVATCGSKRRMVLDGMSVARLYALYGKFVMDTLAVVPFFVLISAITAADDGAVGSGRRLWGLLSLMRLIRLLRLFNTVKFLVVINLCASLMVLLATYYGDQGLDTWFGGMKWVDFESVSPSVLWVHSAYWVITVLTTTGQGQAPRRLGEQILSNFCSVYGMVFNGLVVGIVGEALMRASGDASALLLSKRDVARATSWAAMRHLNPKLTKELQVFFADPDLAHRDMNKEAGYILALPTSLRREVLQHIMKDLLQRVVPAVKSPSRCSNLDFSLEASESIHCPDGAGVSWFVPGEPRGPRRRLAAQTVHIFNTTSREPELQDLLASMFRPVDVPRGHDLCRQGTPADRLWVLEWGNVVAQRQNEVDEHPTTGMSCLLGETVLLKGVVEAAGVRPWTLQTTSACRLWELHLADIERLLWVEPSLVTKVLQYVKERLIDKLVGVPERDRSWCELVTVLNRILKQPAMLDCAADNLEALVQARPDDSSLPLLLSSWLEAVIANPLYTELSREPATRKRGLVTMALQPDGMVGAAAAVGPYGSAAQHPLGAPSLAILSRYGTMRGGAGAGSVAGSGGGGSVTARGLLSGDGSGVPGSPLAVVPAASPATLALQPSSGGGADDDCVADAAIRSSAGNGELPQGSLPGPGALGGGSSGEAEPGRRAVRGMPCIARRSRSGTRLPLSDGGGGNGDGIEGDGVTAAAAVRGMRTEAQSQPQLMTPGLGGSSSGGGGLAAGRPAPSLSRFAAAALTARRAPWVETAAAAAAVNLRSRRATRRASMSDNGVVAFGGRDATCDRDDEDDEDGGGGGSGGGAAGAEDYIEDCDASDVNDDTCEDTEAVVDGRSASVIAHTQMAYSVFSALPSGASGGLGPRSPSPQRSPGAAAVNGTAGSRVGSPRVCPFSDSDSPRVGAAADADGSSDGGGSFLNATGAARQPRLSSLARARSAHTLPLVPEEEGLMRSSSDGGGSGAGGVTGVPRQAAATADAFAGKAAGPAAWPAALDGGRTSAPVVSNTSIQRASTASGFRRGGSSGGMAAAAVSSAAAVLARHHGVSRSRSTSWLASGTTTTAVAAAPTLPRVREEGTATGSGDCYDADARSMFELPAADTAGSVSSAVEPGLLPPPPAAELQQRLSGGAISDAVANGALLPRPPVAAASQQAGAAAVRGEGSGGGVVSDRLPQLVPLPDRVYKLRVRTSGASGGSTSFGTADVASSITSSLAWPHSPSAAVSGAGAAAVGGRGNGPCHAAATLCTTCGKCTCAACRSRAMATAMAFDQGTVAAGRVPSLPYSTLRLWGLGPSTRVAGAADQAGATAAVGGPAAVRMPGAAISTWARGAGGAGGAGGGVGVGVGGAGIGVSRGPETWRRRRPSSLTDLSMSSVPLVP